MFFLPFFFQKIHPPYKENAYLLLQVFGIKIKYTSLSQTKSFLSGISSIFKGNKLGDTYVENKSEDQDEDARKPLAWCAMPLFNEWAYQNIVPSLTQGISFKEKIIERENLWNYLPAYLCWCSAIKTNSNFLI